MSEPVGRGGLLRLAPFGPLSSDAKIDDFTWFLSVRFLSVRFLSVQGSRHVSTCVVALRYLDF